jgi:hypothetical protein
MENDNARGNNAGNGCGFDGPPRHGDGKGGSAGVFAALFEKLPTQAAAVK